MKPAMPAPAFLPPQASAQPTFPLFPLFFMPQQVLPRQPQKRRNLNGIGDKNGGEKLRVFSRLRGFKAKDSRVWSEITRRFGSELKHGELLSIAEVVAANAGVQLDRDAKRRKSVLIKWFEENWIRISPFLNYVILEDKKNQMQQNLSNQNVNSNMANMNPNTVPSVGITPNSSIGNSIQNNRPSIQNVSQNTTQSVLPISTTNFQNPQDLQNISQNMSNIHVTQNSQNTMPQFQNFNRNNNMQNGSQNMVQGTGQGVARDISLNMVSNGMQFNGMQMGGQNSNSNDLSQMQQYQMQMQMRMQMQYQMQMQQQMNGNQKQNQQKQQKKQKKQNRKSKSSLNDQNQDQTKIETEIDNEMMNHVDLQDQLQLQQFQLQDNNNQLMSPLQALSQNDEQQNIHILF
ncbi:hypothetical protein TRFO_34769 [Tritrichomonas foetus]|uniref:Uncharacterized protein n=1 Tax=Tritrichomonas foetus TaxID=1144522 RepID=A0A1J4JMY3_9EUKA|nr:hypothetical protein TRFO_34769 [Tritrichomonas foetus]|eukprot:OHS98901.1 hypothetical protein TRFO_34769 [Tritrichomonas foetus]